MIFDYLLSYVARKLTSQMRERSIKAAFFLLPFLAANTALAMDWELRSSSYLAAEGGWLSGSKVPLSSNTQSEYDKESSKSGSLNAASDKIKTLRLQGPEWLASGVAQIGYEGFSDDLNWQANIDAIGSAVVGNSTGSFYNPPTDPIFPSQGRGGRNSGWAAGVSTGFHFIPLSGFSMHLRNSFTTGADVFRENFSRLHLSPALQIKAARFVIHPAYSWQRLLSPDALPAADISAWSLDLEWLGNRFLRFQNPAGFPLIKTWKASALGSSLLVRALENEGSYLEVNLTPKIIFTGSLFLTSHFRSVTATELSYVAPSLADAINQRGRKSADWSPTPPSADYSSHTIEWKNSLTQRIERNIHLSLSVLYTSRQAAFTPSAFSKLQYSALIDAARESSFRYFLGSEFLL